MDFGHNPFEYVSAGFVFWYASKISEADSIKASLPDFPDFVFTLEDATRDVVILGVDLDEDDFDDTIRLDEDDDEDDFDDPPPPTYRTIFLAPPTDVYAPDPIAECH